MADIPAWKVAATLLRTVNLGNSTDHNLAREAAQSVEQLAYDLDSAKNHIKTLEYSVKEHLRESQAKDTALEALEQIKADKEGIIEHLRTELAKAALKLRRKR